MKRGYNNLRFLVEYYDDKRIEEYSKRLLRDGFRGICRKDIASLRLGELTENEDYIFDTLMLEAKLPTRIIWGYNGFNSEYTFRQSFYNYLSGNLTVDMNNKIGGFGPHNFPNLIICGKYSMIKMNGMPYGSPVLKDNWWPFYASSSYNPTHYLLEQIWTRLSYKHDLPMEIFGDDLTLEPLNRFLDCRLEKKDEHYGWGYNLFTIRKDRLIEDTKLTEWMPTELDEKQQVIISELCKKGEIDLIEDKELEGFVIKGGYYGSLSEFLEKIKSTGLVCIVGNKLTLLTDKCQCVIVNGKYYAGEDKSGRLTRWVFNQIEKKKVSKSES